jgi:general secretion pathway protein G
MILRRKSGNASSCDSAPCLQAEPPPFQPAQPQRVPGTPCCRKKRGFTIIELMIVISIIIILMGIAVPLYQQSLIRARESVLREDLYTLRNAIDQYTLDKQRAPQTLTDVAQAGYVKSIPRDPFTDSNDTWTTEMEDSLRSLDQQQPGIADVHSGSGRIGSDGTPYNTW